MADDCSTPKTLREFAGDFDFLKSMGIERVVAFSGGSDENEGSVKIFLEQSMDVLKDFPVAVLTGGTNWGIPKYATLAAGERGIKTIGVMPEYAVRKGYSLGDKLDFEFVAKSRMRNSEFGDESEVFAKLADGMIVIGGFLGTAVEFYHVMKMNERKIKYGETPTYISPVKGFGGFSESILKICLPKRVKEECLPSELLENGADAVKFLTEKMKI